MITTLEQARDYVNFCRKECKKQNFKTRFMSRDELNVGTYMMLVTTEANQHYLANNSHYQQVMNELFTDVVDYFFNKKRSLPYVYTNMQYQQLLMLLMMFSALDTKDEYFYDNISVVNATKMLINEKMLHSRWLDIAEKYVSESKIDAVRYSE
jgi:hypothetical protein